MSADGGHIMTRRRTAVRLVPLTPELLALAVALERDPIVAEMSEGPEFARKRLLQGLAFAMLEGGTLLGAGGLMLRHVGRSEAWMLVSHLARPRHLMLATRHVRGFFDKRQRDPLFRRIEIFVRDAPWRASFARGLGMTEAHGPLTAWGPDGADYWLYARVAR